MNPNLLGSLLVRSPNQRGLTQTLLEENQCKPVNGLNPWTTANPKPSQDRIEPSSRNPPSLYLPMDNPPRKMLEGGSGMENSILRQPGGVPRDLELPPIQQIPGLWPPAPSLAVSPRNPYRSPISTPPRMTRPSGNATTIGSSEGRGAVDSMLQSPPQSIAPRARRPTGTWSCMYNHERLRLRMRRQMMNQARLTTGDDMTQGRGQAKGSTTTFPESAADWARPAGTHPPRRDWYTHNRPQTSAARDKEPQGMGLPTTGGLRTCAMGRPHPLPGTTSRKIRRLNTELLPLEACSQDTPRLMQTTSVNITRLARRLNTAAVYDTYVCKGTLEEGLDKTMGSTEVARIEGRLRAILATRAPDVGTESQIELNLLSGLKGKSKQT